MRRSVLVLSKAIVVAACFFGIVREARAQVATYTATRTTGITFTSIAGTGSVMSGTWRNTNTNTDDNLSASQAIGFPFLYDGASVSTFSMSTNGYLTFNTGTSAVGSGTGAYGYDNVAFSSTSPTGRSLAPMYDDLVTVGNPSTLAGLNNAMHYQLTGSAPNRVMTVEWTGMEVFGNAGPNLNFQIKLYETSNIIEFLYGTMTASTATYTYTCGLNSLSISASPTATELFTQQTQNSATFSNTAANSLATIPATNSKILFHPNDNCTGGAGQNQLTVNPSTTCTTSTIGSSVGATLSQAGCAGTADDDVWYSFVATGTAHTITVTPAVTGGMSDVVLQAFSGACGSLTQVGACTDGTAGTSAETLALTGLTASTTYRVRVHSFASGSGQGAFTICVTTPVTGPANDNPCGAIALTVGSSCSLSAQSWTSATATTTPVVPAPSCASYSTGDVWFTAVVPSTGNLTVDMGTGTITDSGMSWYTATSCSGTFTEVECDDDDSGNGNMSMIARTGMTPGTIIYIRVWDFNDATTGGLSICAWGPPPTNDGCPGTTLTPGAVGAACAGATTGTVEFATQSIAPITCGTTSATAFDAWYSFVATAASHVITVVGSASFDAVVDLRTGACNGSASLCADATSTGGTEVITATGLTTGNTYLVRVYHKGAAMPATTTFTICVTTPVQAPANDNCGSAIAITCPSTTSGTTVNATQDSPAQPGTCGVTISTAGSVWYTFTPTTTASYMVSLCSADGGAASYDSKLFVYSGACGAYTCVGGDDDGCSTASKVTFTGTSGTVYRIMVAGFSTNTGTFSLVLMLANDLVCNATPIACGATLSSTTIGGTSTGTYEGTTTCGYAQAQPAVWHTITGSGVPMTASLCSTAWDSRIAVYSSTACTALTCIGGVDDNGPACAGTPASFSWSSVNGTVYYIRVWGFSSNSDYSLTVTCAAPPTITSFSPSHACVGATFTVNGTNLTGCSAATVNGVAATIGTITANSVVLTVPSTTSGPVSLTCPGGTVSSAGGVGNFTPDPLPTLQTLSGGASYCPGSTTSFTLGNSQTGVSYQLYNDVTASGSPIGGSTGSGLTFGPSAFSAGTYTVIATTSLGCTATMTGSITLTVNALPTVSITPNPATICNGQSVVLTAAGSPSNSLADVLSVINANSTTLLSTIPTPSGFTDGNTGTSILDGCSDMYDGGNTINTNLATAIAYTNGVVTSLPSAFGTGGQYFTKIIGSNVCGSSATMFIWAGDISGLTSLSITGDNGADGAGTQTSTSFTRTANGVTYTCLLKRVYGATDPSINHLFLIPTPNSASQAIGATTNDDLHTITGISGVTRFYYLLYAGAAGALIDDAAAQNIAQTFANVIPTANGYSWSPGGATTAAVTVSPTITTTYTVTYNNGICSNTAARQVTVNPRPTATLAGNGPFCASGSPQLTGTLTGTGPWSITYTTNGVSQTPVTGIAGPGYTINPTGPITSTKTYAITAITDGNGCSANTFPASVSVVVNSMPNAGSNGSTTRCLAGATFQPIFNLLGTPQCPGTWAGPGGFSSTDCLVSLNPATALSGTYTYTATGTSPCPNVSADVAVTILPAFSAGSVGSGDQSFCASGTPNAMGVTGAGGSGSLDYQWYSQSGIVTCPSGSSLSGWTSLGTSNGANTATYTPTAAVTSSTTYACFVTPGGTPTCGSSQWANGCRKITVNPLPTATLAGNGPFCASGSPQLTGTFTGTAPWSITYTTNGGSSATVSGIASASYTINPTGPITSTTTYAITAISDVNCSATSFPASVQVVVNPLPVVTCGSYGPVCTDAADITLGGSPSGGNWTGTGVTGNSFDPSAGTQTLTYTYSDGNSCTNFCNTTITVNPLPTITCPGNSTVCLSTPTYALTGGSPAGGTYSGGAGVSGNNFAAAIAGPGAHTITYSYTDGNGCTNTPCTFTITVEDADTDEDGTPDYCDGCPLDDNKTAPGSCGCGNPDPGSACDDGLSTTGEDTVQPDCSCLGVPVDCNYVVNGTDLPGTSCDDGNPDTWNDTWSTDCLCEGQLEDCEGVTGGTAYPGTSCDDGSSATGDDTYQTDCSCVGQVIDCMLVPGGTDLPGTPCDDNNGNTSDDEWQPNCDCVGTVICAGNPVVLEIGTDSKGEETDWAILPEVGSTPVCSGPALDYADNAVIIEPCCLPDGCYRLRVYDSFGDGMTVGGYRLKDANSERIIDNWQSGVFTATSAIANNGTFCVPVGTDAMQASSCDALNLSATSVVAAVPNSAVTAQNGIGTTNTDDGYQFWLYDPDGSYSRMIFKSITNPGQPGTPAGPTAPAYLKLNSITTSPVPPNVKLNIKVRSRVNGTNAPFGPACTMMISQCPVTQLFNQIGDPDHSCGVTGKLVNANHKLHCYPVSGANKYQWRFQSGTYNRTIATTSTILVLNAWGTNPLLCGTYTYNVSVHASFDNGTTYCPYGAVCTVGITNSAPNPCTSGGGSLLDVNVDETARSISLWPNPVREGSVTLDLTGLSPEANTATVDVVDMFGKRVMALTLATDGAQELNTVLQLEDVATGLYVVNVTSGTNTFTERLVVE